MRACPTENVPCASPPLPAVVDSFDFLFVIAGSNKPPGSFRIVTGGSDCDNYTTDLSGLVTAPNDRAARFHDVTM